MQTIIFYFTGTGNSLAAARKIANSLGETELVSIPELFQKKTVISASRIGFVFPVYGWTVPRMVTDFVRKLDLKKEQYIFAVATCAGISGNALLHLAKILNERGGVLAAGFVAVEADNSLMEMPGIIKVARKLQSKKYLSVQERLPEILDTIQNCRNHKPDTSSFITNTMSNFMEGKCGELLKAADANFRTTIGCIGCGICKQICPRQNIQIIAQKPVWNYDCEQCMACIQWCPQEAIEFSNHPITKEHYHHPEVSLKDMKKVTM